VLGPWLDMPEVAAPSVGVEPVMVSEVHINRRCARCYSMVAYLSRVGWVGYPICHLGWTQWYLRSPVEVVLVLQSRCSLLVYLELGDQSMDIRGLSCGGIALRSTRIRGQGLVRGRGSF